MDFEKGERAVTHYRVLDSRNDYSLVQLSLETGRTHQIRVHMGYLGHPLLGDYLYYPDFSRIKRVSLHSYALSFTHPMTGSPLTFRAPLPEDMLICLPDVCKRHRNLHLKSPVRTSAAKCSGLS